jgi:hypothetical protein
MYLAMLSNTRNRNWADLPSVGQTNSFPTTSNVLKRRFIFIGLRGRRQAAVLIIPGYIIGF